MKKNVPLFLFVITALILSGCSPVPYRTVKDIKKSGVLNVYVYEAGEPFVYYENGALTGMEIDVVVSIAESLGVLPAFTSVTRGEVYSAIQEGIADIGVGMFMVSSAAENLVSFTAPMASEQLFAVRRNVAGAVNTDTIGAIREKTVAVVEGSASETALAGMSIPSEQVEIYPSPLEAMNAVLSGERDVLICGGYFADECVIENSGFLVAEYITNSKDTEFSAMVSKGNTTLLNEANNIIKESRQE